VEFPIDIIIQKFSKNISKWVSYFCKKKMKTSMFGVYYKPHKQSISMYFIHSWKEKFEAMCLTDWLLQ